MFAWIELVTYQILIIKIGQQINILNHLITFWVVWFQIFLLFDTISKCTKQRTKALKIMIVVLIVFHNSQEIKSPRGEVVYLFREQPWSYKWKVVYHSGKYRFQLNSLRPRQNGRHFADDIFKCIFLIENVLIPVKISLKFVPKGPINNIPALVQIMAWRRSGDKPLSEPMMNGLLTHICVTRPQWVKSSSPRRKGCHFADIFKCIFVNKKFCILIRIPLKFVPNCPIDNKPTLVQVMAWCWMGNKLLPDPVH